MNVLDRTVFDFPLTWNRTRFVATRNKCRSARKLIEISINVQFEKQLRSGFSHNIEIEENINDINQRLLKYHDKLRVLDNMIELASQSLRTYFDKRMENLRAIVKEHCNMIQQIIHEESEHWKEIHSVLNQNLLNPGDIRSRNNYPRVVQKSPASNIDTIEEEDDDEEHVSKLLNGKTLTPLLTQMIRRSRIESKRLTIVPSIKVQIPSDQETSILRKDGRFSIHILPLSTVRQPLEFVDTTFVIKPEETMIGGEIQHDEYYDEPNGSYRAPNQQYHSYLAVTQPDTLLIDSQPNIPPRLCFTPTILYDATVSHEDDVNEQSSSLTHKKNKTTINTIFSSIDQNQTNIKKVIENTHHFGQTFLLDIIKTEQISDDHNRYKRPTISDDDVLIIADINPSVISSEHISQTTNDNLSSKLNPQIQQESITVQETVLTKPRKRTTTNIKSKPVIVSARKTRSAAKVIAEGEAAAAAARALLEKPIEKKRKTRKRKQSKSVDRLAETSDDENATAQSNFIQIITNKRKTKKHKKSTMDYHSHDTINNDDNNNNNNDNLSTNNKRKTQRRSKSKRHDDEAEILNDNEYNKRKTKKFKKSKIDYDSHETSDDNDNNDNLTINNRRRTKRRNKSKIHNYEEEMLNDNQNNKRKTKKYKKSKIDYHSYETSDDDNNNDNLSNDYQRKTQRHDHEEEILNNNENNKRKTKKSKEKEITDNEHELITSHTKSKKSKLSTINNEEKKRKQKIKKTKIDVEEQAPKYKCTRLSPKFIPINTNVNLNECNTCRRSENSDRMKLMEFSNQIAALTIEETKLKSLHRGLEMRIKRFLHRTHNSIRIQEKLLNIEKRSKKELLIRKNLITHEKPSKEYKKLCNNVKKIEEDNINLEKNIRSLCNKIKQFEKDSQQNTETYSNQYDIVQNNNKTKLIQAENQLHRMNLELSKICANNAELRTDIKHMLDKRREMIEEYNRLRIAMQNATDESRQLTSECSESFANRRNMVARMRAIRDQHERDEKKLLDDIRELDRLSESNYASKNFIIKKSNVRQEQIRLNELFAGKRSKGVKSAYTADEFRRLFRIGFNQDFFKEKVLNRTVETFLDEQEQVFTLFEYAVELINELDRLHQDLDNKRKYISNIFSNDNIDSFVIKDVFATLEYSVNKANMNVQSLKIAKKNLREILNTAYQLIYNLFLELNCDRNMILSSDELINDRNIIFYLATIESRVQQLLFTRKINRKGGGTNGYTDDTTISWRIDHRDMDQSYN
ncbi:unnamed protein product [Rotaria sp. Silwood1]|nr:unnamed protein product [Rotaria sp. Silwood1]CAF0745335.1 unnamed protein product [Rotaria sp. Silwood1]CAF3347499.1 unnamed protein product [Rotaria sp. Silwood1]